MCSVQTDTKKISMAKKKKPLSPAEYGGFILAFEPTRTEKISEYLSRFDEVSESFSTDDWAFERCELVLLARRNPNLQIFAAALMRTMSGGGGTRRTKMRLGDPVLFDPPILSPLHLKSLRMQELVSTAENLKRVDAATWANILTLLKSSRPEMATDIDILVERRTEDRRLIGDGERISRLAEERDAIGLCLDIAGGDRMGILRSAKTSNVHSARSILDLLDTQPIAERSIIEHDARIFESLLTGNFGSGRFPTTRGREVRTYVTDSTPIETATGVDLLIYQEHYDSFLMLQYKGMQHNSVVPGWSYRVDGSNLDQQLTAMTSIRLAMPAPPATNCGPIRDQRLNDEPFYFKFCERTRPSARDDSLVSGITISAPLLEHFLNQPESTSQGHGRRVGYQNCPRYLSNSEFIALTRAGWIGCRAPTSAMIASILSARSEGRAAIFAVIEGQKELKSQEKGRIYR
jgi:hypothetical protein